MTPEEMEAAVASYAAERYRYEGFAHALNALFRQLCAQRGVEPLDIEYRAKDPASLREKLQRRPGYESLDDVADLCGVRVITYYTSDADKGESMIMEEFDVEERVQHGAEQPEAFGYASTHLVIRLRKPRVDLPEWSGYQGLRAEVQVRTVLQHAWAAISHKLEYKSEAAVPAPTRRKLYRVAALLESGDELFDSFRGDVQDLRAEYEQQSDAGKWKDLALDSDALDAARAQLPIADIEEEMRKLGFKVPGGVVRWDDNVQDIVGTGSDFGLKTLGDLVALLPPTKSEVDVLRKVAKVESSNGNPFYFTAMEFLELLMMVRKPGLVLRRKFAPQIEDVVLGAAGGEG